jgi:hypothetical protein
MGWAGWPLGLGWAGLGWAGLGADVRRVDNGGAGRGDRSRRGLLLLQAAELDRAEHVGRGGDEELEGG